MTPRTKPHVRAARGKIGPNETERRAGRPDIPVETPRSKVNTLAVEVIEGGKPTAISIGQLVPPGVVITRNMHRCRPNLLNPLGTGGSQASSFGDPSGMVRIRLGDGCVRIAGNRRIGHLPRHDHLLPFPPPPLKLPPILPPPRPPPPHRPAAQNPPLVRGRLKALSLPEWSDPVGALPPLRLPPVSL